MSGIDDKFLDHVQTHDWQAYHKPVILDGFPRSLDQLLALVSRAIEQHWALIFIYIKLDDNTCIHTSFVRQMSRDFQEQKPQNLNLYSHKIIRAFRQDLQTIEVLSSITNTNERELQEQKIVKLHVINAMESIETINLQIRGLFGTRKGEKEDD